jgi:hypothetical protein
MQESHKRDSKEVKMTNKKEDDKREERQKSQKKGNPKRN